MAQNSKIEWTDHTANLWWGCTKVHEGCDNCYAEALDNRYNHKNKHWGNAAPRKAVKSVWNDLKKFQVDASTGKTPAKTKFREDLRSVFVGSMMDIFEKPMPLEAPVKFGDNIEVHNIEYLRNYLFTKVIPASPNLLFLLLTKRPSNINTMIPEEWKTNPPVNVMFGTSVVNQETAYRLIPQLLRVNGKRFLSIEPQLDAVNLTHMEVELQGDKEWCTINCLTGEQTDMGRPCHDVPKIDWVICGGESGAGKRPFNLDWGRALRDQCKSANVPFFFKQVDKIQPISEDLMIREFPKL